MALNKLIATWALEGAEKCKGKHGPMCNDCAFKTGSDANTNDESAVDLAAAAVAYGMAKFNCHTKDFKDAGIPCKGYLYALERTEDGKT